MSLVVTYARSGRGGLAVVLALLLGAGSARAASLKEAQELLAGGKYAEAEPALVKLGAAGALSLARLYLETGRTDKAIRSAQGAAKGKDRAAALTLVGEAQRLAGQLAVAEKTLKAVIVSAPKHYRALAFLALVYHEQGKAADAKATFDVFYDDYRDDKLKKTNGEHLTYVAMACRYTDNFRDASDTYRDAVQADPKQIEAYLQWAEISLEKYEAGYAEKHYQSALKINPSRVEALIGLAQVKLEQTNDVEASLKLLDRAEKISPGHMDAAALRAQILIDTEQNLQAEALLTRALQRNGNHLPSLTMMAASFFLRDDLGSFERTRAKIFALNPRYTRFFHDVVELGVRHHRYSEAIELSKRAIKIDPQDWYSLADLGTNYLRMGDDANGLKYLREAWKGDRYNVRNYNLLNLFEDDLAKGYVFVSSPHFQLRVHKEDQALIKRTLVPVLERAYGIYVKKYRFTPKGPIVVELFRDPNQYAVRTVGLPGLSATAVCFGRVITATSPLLGQYNWGQVFWHELNHIFTIQMSRSRVPRWLTEGLAEMEPILERPEWKRENDFDIYKALRANKLKGLAAMNTAFTQAKSLQDMVVAYHHGAMMVFYLVKQWGLQKIAGTMAAYGKGQRTEQILPSVTGLPLAELDKRFRDSEAKRLAFYNRNWFVDVDSYSNLEARQQAIKARPDDATARADLALALLVAGKAKEAAEQAKQALGKEPTHKVALYAAAQAALAQGDKASAEPLLRRLLAAGGNGYDVRLAMGQLALARNDLRAAATELNAAKALDPERGQPYAMLFRGYEKAGKTDEMIAELKGLAAIDQQSFSVVAKLVDLLAKKKDYAGVRRYGEMAYFIHPAAPRLHSLLAEALSAAAPTPMLDKAVWHLETALLGQPEKPAELYVQLAKVQVQRKDTRRAKEALAKALKADPANAEAKAMSGKIR
jgi:cellulose synthase operon protein C